MNANCEMVAANAGGFWGGTLLTAIRLDETKTEQSEHVWTGTRGDGDATAANCDNWSATLSVATTGDPMESGSKWVQLSAETCGGFQHLYCVSAAG